MSDLIAFEGFPAEGLQFLTDLAANNNKEWFDAHKKTYKKSLQQPAQALVQELGTRLQTIDAQIRFDTRTNGGGSLMRINRDVRFSKDKSPYKTNISMMFWHGTGKKTEHPAFGMQITPHDTGLMAGMFGFSKDMLAAYREAVDSKKGAALEKIVADLDKSADYDLDGEQYKRVPTGYDKDHPRGDLLKYKGLWVRHTPIAASALHSPEFVDICMTHFEAMSPLYLWLTDVQDTMLASS